MSAGSKSTAPDPQATSAAVGASHAPRFAQGPAAPAAGTPLRSPKFSAAPALRARQRGCREQQDIEDEIDSIVHALNDRAGRSRRSQGVDTSQSPAAHTVTCRTSSPGVPHHAVTARSSFGAANATSEEQRPKPAGSTRAVAACSSGNAQPEDHAIQTQGSPSPCYDVGHSEDCTAPQSAQESLPQLSKAPYAPHTVSHTSHAAQQVVEAHSNSPAVHALSTNVTPARELGGLAADSKEAEQDMPGPLIRVPAPALGQGRMAQLVSQFRTNPPRPRTTTATQPQPGDSAHAAMSGAMHDIVQHQQQLTHAATAQPNTSSQPQCSNGDMLHNSNTHHADIKPGGSHEGQVATQRQPACVSSLRTAPPRPRQSIATVSDANNAQPWPQTMADTSRRQAMDDCTTASPPKGPGSRLSLQHAARPPACSTKDKQEQNNQQRSSTDGQQGGASAPPAAEAHLQPLHDESVEALLQRCRQLLGEPAPPAAPPIQPRLHASVQAEAVHPPIRVAESSRSPECVLAPFMILFTCANTMHFAHEHIASSYAQVQPTRFR